jgi:hypothetical protein
MTHIEDKVLYGGVRGTREAINALRNLRDTLAGYKESKVSVKWDGAPAIFAGIDPRDGKFFVAKKGIFNKNPKVYKTKEEIDADTSGDLADKLKDALTYLPELGIKGVIQGDFLFGRGDLSVKRIHGEKYVTFHPNTIVYAIPYHESESVRKAKIGIVWHTTYKGSTFESMKASYGVNVGRLKQSKNVWSQDAILRDLTSATMTQSETKVVDGYLSMAGKLFSQISGTTLAALEAHPELPQLIEQYNNTFVRRGEIIKDTKKHTEGLVKWITLRFRKEILARKTDKGKRAQQERLDGILEFFSPQNRRSLHAMFELQKVLVLAKLTLINKMNSLSNYSTFVKTNRGYKVTGDEGYVAIDTLGGDAVKLVDRMEFSYNNFSPSILKGWDSKSRN